MGDVDMAPLKIIGSVFSLALGNAGVDNSNLYYGFVNELPSSEEELEQLLGRIGRGLALLRLKMLLIFVATLRGYQSMLRKIHFSILNLKSTQKNKDTTELMSKRDLVSVLRLLVLRLGCF